MRVLLIPALALAVISSAARAEDHALGARVGLLGAGVEYSYRLTDRLTIRSGLNAASTSFGASEAGIDYDFELSFDSLSVGLDLHPLKGKFRVSLGAMRNDNSLSARSTLAQIITVGGTNYSGDEVGTLRGRIGFDGTAPYLGVGWDWFRNMKVGFGLDVGILSQGSPIVTLSADGPIADDLNFLLDLEQEELELEADLDGFDAYPYMMLGVAFRF